MPVEGVGELRVNAGAMKTGAHIVLVRLKVEQVVTGTEAEIGRQLYLKGVLQSECISGKGA